MAQVSKFLRLSSAGYAHYCPGCKKMHAVPSFFNFDGNLEIPSFYPSIHITFNKDAEGEPQADSVCHYFLTGGKLQFFPDSTHELAGKTVDLPPLPV